MIPTHLLQTGNDIDRSVYEQILQFIRLRVTETYAFPPEIVRVDDITIATLGNFSASVGKPKSKKTFNITAIVAAALSGKNVLRYNAHLPEGKHKVLYVDTEQSKCHCHKVLERILRLVLTVKRTTSNFSCCGNTAPNNADRLSTMRWLPIRVSVLLSLTASVTSCMTSTVPVSLLI